MAIYELPKEIETLLDTYYSMFDEDWIQIATDEEVASIQKELEEKQNQIDDLKWWVLKKRSNAVSTVAWINFEIERLTKLKDSQQKQINQSEKFLKHLFWDIEKPIVFDNYKIGYTKSKSTVIENKDLLPSKFKIIEIKEVEKIPLADIKKAIENGEDVPWAKIQENLKFYIK